MIDSIVAFVIEQLGTNEFFQGGFVLAVMGTLAMWGRTLPTKIWTLFRRIMIVEGDIQQGDEAFKAIIVWLANQPYGRRVKRFTVSLKEDSEGAPEVLLSPSPGAHWVWFNRRLILINRGREKRGGEDMFMGFHESFTFQTFGRGRDVIEDLVKTAVNFYHEAEHGNTRVQLQDGYGGWDTLYSSPKRSLESVVLDGDQTEKIRRDLKWFLDAEAWYGSLGIPYRRGYLFHGPPGTGKSSLCVALAGYFSLDLSIIVLSSPSLDDSKLARMLAQTSKRSILLFEDIDCLFDEDRKNTDANGVTLSGLLNALDGAQAQTGRVVVLTTNHIGVLDDALIRPGRADMRIEFSLATCSQIEILYSKFFPDASTGEAAEFASQVGDKVLSPAEVQGVLMKKVEALR